MRPVVRSRVYRKLRVDQAVNIAALEVFTD